MHRIWAVLVLILGDEELQEMAAGPVAAFLRQRLPDVTEGALASFLERIARNVRTPPTVPTPTTRRL